MEFDQRESENGLPNGRCQPSINGQSNREESGLGLFRVKHVLGSGVWNGVGKSTFLNAIAGQIPFDSGQFVVGETVRIA